MMKPELKKPDESMENEFILFNEEWEAYGEKLVPYAARRRGLTYDAWKNEAERLEIEAPSDMVTAHVWFLMSEGRILGAIALRDTLNDYLRGVGGHIGYGVRPSERRKGYADLMLKEVLVLSLERGMKRVLITCNQGNTGSEKVIIRNGGKLENVIEDGDEMVARYWIKLTSD
ncbi:MAG TPA: GNAT family N-acetyltransferase [Proteiniclasticum sp.]|nr:GNAT family N-acetyltransferase [Proteiniclasticum sp.]